MKHPKLHYKQEPPHITVAALTAQRPVPRDEVIFGHSQERVLHAATNSRGVVRFPPFRLRLCDPIETLNRNRLRPPIRAAKHPQIARDLGRFPSRLLQIVG